MVPNSTLRAHVLTIAVLCFLASAPAQAGGFLLTPTADGSSYVFQDLGEFTPRALNIHGTVIGSAPGSEFGSEERNVAVRWSAATGAEVLPGFEGDTRVSARGINDSGVIVGRSITADEGPERPLIWRDGNVSELVTPFDEGVGLEDINNSGVIAATYFWGGSPNFRNYSTFIHLNDEENRVRIVDDLGDPPGTEFRASARGINAHGDVIGAASSGAFIWSDGEGSTRLPLLPGFDISLVSDVNDSGTVVGENRNRHGDIPIIWSEALGTRELPTGRYEAAASAINNAGEIVGTGIDRRSGFRRFATLWRDEVFLDLNDLTDFGPRQISLLSASDINEAGQIIGVFVVVPEPSTAMLFGMGLAMMSSRRSTSRARR